MVMANLLIWSLAVAKPSMISARIAAGFCEIHTPVTGIYCNCACTDSNISEFAAIVRHPLSLVMRWWFWRQLHMLARTNNNSFCAHFTPAYSYQICNYSFVQVRYGSHIIYLPLGMHDKKDCWKLYGAGYRLFSSAYFCCDIVLSCRFQLLCSARAS